MMLVQGGFQDYSLLKLPAFWCATNADCRLPDWQVNEVNIVVKCFNRFPISKL